MPTLTRLPFDAPEPLDPYAPYSGRGETRRTSEAAAALVRDHVPYLERLVLRCLEARPSTCDELEALTGLAHQTCSARLRGLALRGLIRPSGRRRPTRTGRLAVVWEPLA